VHSWLETSMPNFADQFMTGLHQNIAVLDFPAKDQLLLAWLIVNAIVLVIKNPKGVDVILDELSFYVG